ncbi:PqqD family protein [Flavobacterium sp. CAN_S2]|uniref:PqqD family protein n=1 Tax=Flavobacterium sp. CAN_S2 TaxID=2787726 RepID=UPI0018CB0068
MENKKYLLNTDKVLFTPLEEEGVLYAIEDNKYISLNTTYTSIVQYIAEGLEYNAIVAQLMNEYEVEQKLCEEQLMTVLEDLIAKDYINETTA